MHHVESAMCAMVHCLFRTLQLDGMNKNAREPNPVGRLSTNSFSIIQVRPCQQQNVVLASFLVDFCRSLRDLFWICRCSISQYTINPMRLPEVTNIRPWAVLSAVLNLCISFLLSEIKKHSFKNAIYCSVLTFVFLPHRPFFWLLNMLTLHDFGHRALYTRAPAYSIDELWVLSVYNTRHSRT